MTDSQSQEIQNTTPQTTTTTNIQAIVKDIVNAGYQGLGALVQNYGKLQQGQNQSQPATHFTFVHNWKGDVKGDNTKGVN